MAKDPAFLFYPNDWIGGTMGMTFEQKGAYMELLMMQFNRGHMTSHMIGQEIGQLWDTIKDKFKEDDNGLWYNVRLELEQKKRKKFTESRRNNISGKNQYTKPTKETGHMTKHMEDVNEDENINVIEIEEPPFFEDFWNLYDKKRGDVGKVKKKWKKLKHSERVDVMFHIPDYIQSTPDKTYRKDPMTYLNGRGWEDEILIKNNGSEKVDHEALQAELRAAGYGKQTI